VQDIQIGDIEATRPSAWAVRGVVGGVSILWGPYGSYKTFMAIGISVAVAAGKPWFGCSTRQGPVLYILGEGGLELFRRRAGECARDMGIDLHGLPLWVRGEALDLSSPWKLTPYLERWDQISPVMFVVDTVSRCLPGDENKQEVMQGFVGCLDLLRERYNASVLALHHAGKDQTIRGSSVLPGAADVSIRIWKSREGGTKKLHLEPVKLRDLDVDNFDNTVLLPDVVDVRTSNGRMILDEYGDKVTTLVLRQDPEVGDNAAKAIAQFATLQNQNPDRWVGFKEWAMAMPNAGVPLNKFKRALSEILLHPDSYGIVSPERGQYCYARDYAFDANPFESFSTPGINYGDEEE